MGHFSAQGLANIRLLTFAGAAVVAASVAIWIWRFRRNPRYLPRDLRGAIGGIVLLLFALAGGYTLVSMIRIHLGIRDSIARGGRQLEAEVPPLHYRLALPTRTGDLAELRGQVVLLNLWATWCSPCRTEMPDLDRLAAAYAGHGLRVLALSDEPFDKVAHFVEGRDTPAWIGVIDAPQALGDPYALMRTNRPLTLLIDRDGRLRDFFVGLQTYASLEQAVRPLLDKVADPR